MIAPLIYIYLVVCGLRVIFILLFLTTPCLIFFILPMSALLKISFIKRIFFNVFFLSFLFSVIFCMSLIYIYISCRISAFIEVWDCRRIIRILCSWTLIWANIIFTFFVISSFMNAWVINFLIETFIRAKWALTGVFFILILCALTETFVAFGDSSFFR